MKYYIKTSLLLAFSFLVIASVRAQESGFSVHKISNTKESVKNVNDWSFGLGTGTSMSLKNNQGNLFRGNGVATKMFGKYYFGNIGLSASTGILPGTINQNSLNQFLKERGFSAGETKVSRSNPFNAFLLFGPSFRFGNKVYVNADLQAGLFLNNPGTVDVSTDQRSLYHFSNDDQNYFPGFSGTVSLNYPLNSSTHFFISGDYLQTKSAVSLLDLKGGYDVATRVERNVKMMVAGIGIVKTFSTRSPARKRPGNLSDQNITMRETGGTCGPVTVSSENPNGSVDQITFACPEDAARYSQNRLRNPTDETYNPWETNDLKSINSNNSMPSRLSMTPTTARQTQGKSFGEKVASGLQAGTGIISGRISWQQESDPGIITNEMAAVSSVGGMTKAGGATSSSYAAGKMMNPGNGPLPHIINSVLYVRKSGRGESAGSREYQQAFIENLNSSCDDCGFVVKNINESPSISSKSEIKNPLYSDNGQSGNNPIYQSQQASGNPLYSDNHASPSNPLYNGGKLAQQNGTCGTTDSLQVFLYDASRRQVASTQTDSCGNFWFANVPEGPYTLRIQGETTVQKSYEVSITKDGKYDVGGELKSGDAHLVLDLFTQSSDSNVLRSKVVVRGWDPEKKEMITRNGTGNSQRVSGSPIGGIVVKGGKNPGGRQMRTTETDQDGRFEFVGLKKGEYLISAEVPYSVNEQTIVVLGEDRKQWGDPHENSNGKMSNVPRGERQQ